MLNGKVSQRGIMAGIKEAWLKKKPKQILAFLCSAFRGYRFRELQNEAHFLLFASPHKTNKYTVGFFLFFSPCIFFCTEDSNPLEVTKRMGLLFWFNITKQHGGEHRQQQYVTSVCFPLLPTPHLSLIYQRHIQAPSRRFQLYSSCCPQASSQTGKQLLLKALLMVLAAHKARPNEAGVRGGGGGSGGIGIGIGIHGLAAALEPRGSQWVSSSNQPAYLPHKVMQRLGKGNDPSPALASIFKFPFPGSSHW